MMLIKDNRIHPDENNVIIKPGLETTHVTVPEADLISPVEATFPISTNENLDVEGARGTVNPTTSPSQSCYMNITESSCLDVDLSLNTSDLD